MTTEHEDVRISAIKRQLKKLRNLIKDPLPRTKELVFESYEVAWPEIRFTYRVADSSYVGIARFDLPLELLSKLSAREHHSLFVNLGLSFAKGHFLISDFATFRIACAALTVRQCELLSEYLSHGLGEFRYRAGLDPTRPVRVISSGAAPMVPIPRSRHGNRALLLNGGGKDSCVGAGLLEGIGLPYSWLSGQVNAARKRVVSSSGNSTHYSVSLVTSDDINKDGVYGWGANVYLHPICSAALIVAYLTEHNYLVAGFEHSSDDPNIVFKGMPINHQSGKTSVFESFFNEFTETSVVGGISLFSIARPFTDLRLAEMFSHFPQYFASFLSCNVSMGKDRWCNRCHKCAFTYLALYPFLERESLLRIFGEDLFESALIRKHIVALTTAALKPWDCVGTMEENKLALRLCLRKSPTLEFKESPYRRDLERACADVDEARAFSRNLATFLLPHNIPSEFVAPLQSLSQRMLNSSLERWSFLSQSKPRQ